MHITKAQLFTINEEKIIYSSLSKTTHGIMLKWSYIAGGLKINFR